MTSPATLRLAIVGLGKIARDQHLPAIAATAGLELVAVADPHARLDGVACLPALEDLLANGPAFDAVALCTPPQARGRLAGLALAAGKHVLLEKPPTATIAEMRPLVAKAEAGGLTLFAAWHSRFAPAVEPLRARLADRAITRVRIDWKEDVRVWHPGQGWIFEAGGLGVFDPGINALSILTRVLPRPAFVTGATLDVPANRDAPIAATLEMTDAAGVPMRGELDFLQTGRQSWDIRVETDAGAFVLSKGGARLDGPEGVLVDEPEREYPALYARFLELVARGWREVDLAPLELVADAFMLGRRTTVAPFEDHG